MILSLTKGFQDKATRISGFFNAIPGDTALVTETSGFNLVSSSWLGINGLTVREIDASLTPNLRAANGSDITCHGYIFGSWTDFEVENRWDSVMIFVVDAMF